MGREMVAVAGFESATARLQRAKHLPHALPRPRSVEGWSRRRLRSGDTEDELVGRKIANSAWAVYASRIPDALGTVPVVQKPYIRESVQAAVARLDQKKI